MNVFDLFAKIVLDTEDYEKELGEASEKTSGFGEKLKNGLATAGKVAAAGLGAAVTGITALTGAATQSYAEYEQLAGGVETLFKGSSAIVMQYAENAYKTAGLSANEYMETVTSFSASLLQSLGGDTDEAARYADQAITDMADNANKMGTSMTMIQNAYQGFAKQNYTMLDNLKLGYGGTKEEMERLLQDADNLSESFNLQVDESGNLVYSYADIVDAIHIVQTEMGITGTTAKEASGTISGSVSSMKSAWKNLVTGIADENANLTLLMGNFVDSIGTVAQNIIPRVQVALESAGEMIDTVIPTIIETIFPLIEEHLPAILKAGVKIIKTLLEGILQNSDQIVDTVMTVMDVLIDGIIDLLPEIVVTGVILLGKLAVGIIQAIPDLIKKIPEIITAVVEEFKANGETFAGIGKDIVTGIWNGIKAAWTAVVEWVGSAVDSVMNFISGSKEKAQQEIDSIGDIPVTGGGGSADSGGAGRRTGTVNVTQNIYSQAKTAADLMEEAQYQQKKAVWLGVPR